MYIFNRYRQEAAEVDARITRLKQELRKAEEIKKRLVWCSYFWGGDALLRKKRLRVKKNENN